VVRPLRAEETRAITDIRQRYEALKEEYRRELGDGF
jgi:hypothetical protein